MSKVRFLGMDVHAEKLARCHRAGDLTAVWVPDAAPEALRDLIRAREDARQDQQRARQRLGKFLLRHGWRPREDIKKNWTKKHQTWIKSQVRFDLPALQVTFLDSVHEVEHAADRLERLERAIPEAVEAAPAEIQEVVKALQSLRGIAEVSAATIVAELGSLSRFPSPRELMSYSGLVPREHSSGSRVQRGGITKTGNAHLRRVMVEASWAYRHKPWIGGWLAKRQQGLDEETKAIAWKAQWRLTTRYQKTRCAGQEQTADRHGHRTRVAGLHLGDCRTHRSAADGKCGGCDRFDSDELTMSLAAAWVTGHGHTERRILVRFMRSGACTQPALLVRGSSRRITTMRFRPADIRLINRRMQPLPRLPRCRSYSPLDYSLHISRNTRTSVGNAPARRCPRFEKNYLTPPPMPPEPLLWTLNRFIGGMP